MRYCICGGRDYADDVCVDRVMRYLQARHGMELVIHGDCPTGADRMVHNWCLTNKVPVASVPAHWETLGRPAGPIRNGWMLDLFNIDMVVAFAGGRGTADCCEAARKRGIEVREQRADRW